jgi:hypothetical protein
LTRTAAICAASSMPFVTVAERRDAMCWWLGRCRGE